MIEGVGVLHPSKGAHQTDGFAANVLVVKPIKGIFHDARHGAVVLRGADEVGITR